MLAIWIGEMSGGIVMAIDRSEQTWPADVTATLKNTDGEIRCEYCGFPDADNSCGCHPPSELEQESEIEFERRQRGSASTIAALIVVAMVVTFAIAVLPLIQSLAVTK